MNKIYANQPFLILLSFTDIPGVITKAEIHYKSPSGKRGHFDAMIDKDNNTIYYYSEAGKTLKEVGMWSFWSKIETMEGGWYPGTPVKWMVYREGE